MSGVRKQDPAAGRNAKARDMKKLIMVAAIGLLASTSACGTKEPEPTKKVEPAKKVDPKIVKNEPIEKAMSEIPPELRVTFQDALKCERERSEKKSITITPELIRDLTGRLKADPNVAKC